MRVSFSHPFLLAIVVVGGVLIQEACNHNNPGPTPPPYGDLLSIPYNPQAYTIMKPADFPEIAIPADNPMTVDGVQLGRRLFYDPLLSADSTQSCSSCHAPKGSFTDNLAVSKGIDGVFGNRSAPALLNIAYATNGLFWDGRSPNLEDQALKPVENPIEMHNTWTNVVEKLKKHPKYPELFRKAFGISDKTEITKELAAKAMAQFERILISSGNSKYDQYKSGNTAVFDDDELDGYAMFFEEELKLGLNVPECQCFHCHGGVTLTGNVYFSNGLDSVGSYAEYKDKGLGDVTMNVEDNGKFRSPTLRNIALTAPYMHDGRFKTLEEVLDHYGNHGKSVIPYQNALIQQVGYPIPGSSPPKHQFLSNVNKMKIIKFLHTLTDSTFINNPDIQNPF